MSLSPEWLDRLAAWRKELKNQFFVKLGSVKLEGFATREQLTSEQAAKSRFKPMPEGTQWGAKWEYGWFRGVVAVPKSAAGQRIALRPKAGGESLVFVDGVARGAVSWGREEITLTRKCRGGERFQVLLEAYAGHGPTPCSCGPVPMGRVTVPEPAARQATVGDSAFGTWNEDAFQLYVDVTALLTLRDSIDKDSLRVAEIDAGLKDFATVVDFELPAEEMNETFRAARCRLAPLLAARNSATMPDMFGFGHAHLDVAWLWPLAETERKSARTFSSQLELIDEYPKYKFLQSEPHVYWMCKNRYPKIYNRIKKAVKSGQLVAEGSMWVEPDMNIAGGEALIRQCIHGKRFFREEFGINNQILWLPDVFGYSAALPQILKGCSVNYFATAKIFWNYHGGETFPYNSFLWEGIDGSTILAHLFSNYGGTGEAKEAVSRWQKRVQKDDISSMVFCYGHGDGGGGPTREFVENVRRIKDLEGCPRVRMAGPLQFFKDLEKRGVEARYVGELYYQAHRGTYTSQAKTKRGNRKSEFMLREAEMWAVAAAKIARFRYPAAMMDETWKMVLLNQFHDILPGSSIARVYQEAEAAFAEVVRRGSQVAASATSALVKKGKGVTVFNSLNWASKAIVEIPSDFAGAATQDGATLPVQKVGGKLFAEVAVPSCGWTTVVPSARKERAGAAVTSDNRTLENELLRVKFNDLGEISSIYDKEAKRELAAGPCNSFRMYKDVPAQWDAWDVVSIYKLTPVSLAEKAEIKSVTAGSIMGRLKITRKLNHSRMTQTATLRRGSRQVDFHTTIDWQESHKLLKVAFPVQYYADHALSEIQFGHVRRPNHVSRQYDADRYEVANQKWSALVEEDRGFAVLNDCKYGLNMVGNNINLTLLRAPKAPDMNGDVGRQEFTYSFYAWNGSLADSGVVRAAYELNVPAVAAAGVGGTRSVLTTDAENVVVEAVKPAEDGSGDIIVRLYESMRTATTCDLSLSLPVKSVKLVNMLEETISAVPAPGGKVTLNFRPFEIKTLRIASKG